MPFSGTCFALKSGPQGGFMSNKLVNNKKRNHVEKVLKAMSGKGSQQASSVTTPASDSKKSTVIDPLRDQYEVIRKDILKLREDLSKGYDMARGVLERKGLINEILKLR
jgi:hypothetical protein